MTLLMPDSLRPLAKCGNRSGLCLLDVQWAAELAFADALSELGWSQATTAKRLNVAPNTVKRWLNGDTEVNMLVIETCPELASLFRARLVIRQCEIEGRRAA